LYCEQCFKNNVEVMCQSVFCFYRLMDFCDQR
jgi:hypothetical protein